MPFTRVYRSLEGFDVLREALSAVASVSREAWTDEDAWGAVEAVVTSVADDDLSRRGLLAAKIFLGYRATPDEHAVVPMCAEAIAFAKEERDGEMYTLALIRKLESTLRDDTAFEDSIKLREAYAAPMFSPTSTTPATFRSDRNPPSKSIREVADALLIALIGYISDDPAEIGDPAEINVKPVSSQGGSRWQRIRSELRYFVSILREDQFATGELTGEALADRLEEKRVRIEYRARNMTHSEYRAARDVLKHRRRARAGIDLANYEDQ